MLKCSLENLYIFHYETIYNLTLFSSKPLPRANEYRRAAALAIAARISPTNGTKVSRKLKKNLQHETLQLKENFSFNSVKLMKQ